MITLANGQFWKCRFATDFIPQIEAYGQMWKERFLPPLAELENEATVIEERAYERLAAHADPEWVDPADIADEAHEAGLAYYEQFAPIKQGLINMYAIGLYHLVEQQGFLFLRQVTPVSRTNQNGQRDLSFKDLTNLLKAHDIDVATFQSWPMIEKLNLLADCVKHAQGRACRKLLEKEPDWFTCVPPLLGRPSVQQPLFGQGIYLQELTLWKLTDAARTFWTELGEVLAARDT